MEPSKVMEEAHTDVEPLDSEEACANVEPLTGPEEACNLVESSEVREGARINVESLDNLGEARSPHTDVKPLDSEEACVNTEPLAGPGEAHNLVEPSEVLSPCSSLALNLFCIRYAKCCASG